MQSSTLLKMLIHYCTLWLSSQTADRPRPTTPDCQVVSTVVCRDIISEDLINLGLSMPNCLADNIIYITGHSCDPYVLLINRRLYVFLYCEHFSGTRTG